MGDERKLVGRLDAHRRLGQRLIDLAAIVQRERRRCEQPVQRRGQRRRALGRERALGPRHRQRLASLERGPGRVRHHGHARHQQRRVVEAVDLHHLAHPRHLQRARVVDRPRRLAEDRPLRDRRVFHAGDLDVEAEQPLSPHQRPVVHAGDPRADQPVPRRVLERGLGRHRDGGRAGCQRAVARGAAAGGVPGDAGQCRDLRRGHTPVGGGRRHEHVPRRRAGTPMVVPVGHDRVAAAHALRSEACDRAARPRRSRVSSRRRAPRRRSSAATS